MSVCENIRNKRVESGMSVEEFANAMGVVPSLAKQWEHDVEPEHKRMNEIAEVLDTDIRYLISGEDEADIPMFTVTEEDIEGKSTLNELFNEKVQKQIGLNFKRLRVEHGLTKHYVHEKTKIPFPALCVYEKGDDRRKSFPLKYCEKLADLYNTTTINIVNELIKPIGTGLEDMFRGEDYDSEYPANLISAVYAEPIPMGSINKMGVAEALSSLNENEQGVLELRYKHGMTLEEVGKKYHVTRERIRQIEAKGLRKLRHPERRKCLLNISPFKFEELNQKNAVLRAENARLKEIIARNGLDSEFGEYGSDTNLYEVPIEYLELSVRAYNCLKRAKIETVGVLSEKSVDDLKELRNMGQKSVSEIIHQARKRYGVRIKTW